MHCANHHLTVRSSSLVLLAVGFGSPCELSLVPGLLLVPGLGGIIPQMLWRRLGTVGVCK